MFNTDLTAANPVLHSHCNSCVWFKFQYLQWQGCW